MVIGKLSVLLGLNSAQFQTGMQAAANNHRAAEACQRLLEVMER